MDLLPNDLKYIIWDYALPREDYEIVMFDLLDSYRNECTNCFNNSDLIVVIPNYGHFKNFDSWYCYGCMCAMDMIDLSEDIWPIWEYKI